MPCKSASSPRVSKARLRKAYPLLELVLRLKPADRTVVLQFLNKDGCESVYKCIENALFNEQIPSAQRASLSAKLGVYKSAFRDMIHPKRSAVTKQKRLVQSGTGIGILLATVLPMLAKFIYDKVTKK